MMAGILFQVIFLMYAVYIHITVWDEGVALLGLGLATGSIILSFNVIKKEVPKSIYGMACGMISMFFGGFSILLSPLVGYLYKASSENIQIAVFPIILCSSLAVLVCFALLLIKKKKKIFP